MKIICVENNYKDRGSKSYEDILITSEPVVFSKPDTALLVNNKPFYYPEFSNDIQYETELVIKIAKNGKYIQKKFASSYYKEVAIGIDLTAKDVLTQLRYNNYPWLLSKGFDNSAPISNFIQINSLKNKKEIAFSLSINDEIVQTGNSADMIFDFDELILYISRFISLKMGDIVFTGTPAGVGKITVGDRLKAFIEDKELLNFEIK